MADYRLVTISAALVSAYPEEYNSNFHTQAEAPGQTVPTEGPQRFGHWLPLIARSQGYSVGDVQTIILSHQQATLVLSASDSSIHTRQLNRVYEEELETDLTPSFRRLTFPSAGLFLRLDACSPKDGVQGTAPLTNADQITLLLTSSLRARNAITASLETNGPVRLYFLPFNHAMDTSYEYRVFCPPPAGKIVAITQYRWHTRSILTFEPPDRKEAETARLVAECQRLRGEIEREMGSKAELMKSQGFSFDVLFREGRGVLVELNGFGARSGTGSGLFHWLRDAAVLGGKVYEGWEGKIEVRMSE